MNNRNTGYTVIELLVAITIVSLLIALMLPAVLAAREAARKMMCSNNMRQVGLGCHSYHDVNGMLPWVNRNGPSNPIDTGWGPCAKILPFADESVLYNLLDLNRQTGAIINRPHLTTLLPIFRCPSDPGSDTFEGILETQRILAASSTVAFCDPVVADHSSTRFSDITDGLSNTTLTGEAKIQKQMAVTWVGVIANPTGYAINTQPTIPAISESRPGTKQSLFGEFSSHHSGGVNFLFCDGSVHFISNQIDGHTFETLGSPNGNEVSNYQF